LTLFRFADTIDKVLMFFGTLCAIGNGIALPFFAYPYGRLTQAFAPNTPTDFIVN
jgi:ATP-binding cassette subfamily B (MDR/TAP) protein 1